MHTKYVKGIFLFLIDWSCLMSDYPAIVTASLRRFSFLFVCFIFYAGVIMQPRVMAEPPKWIDTAESRYAVASQQYDRVALQKIAETISRQSEEDRRSAKAQLLLGLIYWRLELFAYCIDDDAQVKRFGPMAIEALTHAEEANEDVYITASHKALASQLLASIGMAKAIKYGPRAAEELKKAQKANPQGYYSLLVEAINACQVPSFAGGDPKKAVLILEKMAKDFPDSADIKIHLADAYIRLDRKDDARRAIDSVTAAFPYNPLAKKVAAKLSK
jgi:tetratricopeptide (TPR) repeat protein